MPTLPTKKFENFNKGLITRIEDESVPFNAASDSMNWLTLGDRIELRRGQYILGDEVDGIGKVSGLFVAERFDGQEEVFKSRAQKIEHYDADSDTWEELGSNVLGDNAEGEDVAFDDYHSLAGAFAYASSPNSSIFKIPIANPDTIVNQSITAHRGKIKIKQGRMMLWDRKDSNGGSDKTGVYGSYIDKDELSDFTETTSENVGTGDGSTKTFTESLDNVTGVKTCMYVRITDGTETFTDDRNGNLVGDQGGTGTVNYGTGAISVTFNTAPTNSQAITADYYTEDAKSGGIVDFSKSTPRTAGQGFTFRQDDGGAEMQNMGSIGRREYCMHTYKTWELTLTSDDTDATNLIYRSKVGLPYWRAMEETGAGIYYVDASDPTNPFVRLLQPTGEGEEVIPISLSDQLDLSNYRFDNSVVKEIGEYILVACRTKDSTVNDTVFTYHTIWKAWDRHDFRCSVIDEYNNTILAGDPASANVYQLFNGWTDDEAKIVNHWISGETDLDKEGVESVRKFVIAGKIAAGQVLKIYFSYDKSPFVEVFEIRGDGDYVDSGSAFTVGSNGIGSTEIGGGGGGVEVYPYRREVKVNTDKFEKIRVKIEASEIGYVSVSEMQFKDRRWKGNKLPEKYRN